ncbi:MAG TPA: polysaccharide pyruvyl transferase family protein [Prolixibacteraceae bacterium]|nr:polysaccharide pyruvyl transferase family protein [Prolixibacteraceae bacterium]
MKIGIITLPFNANYGGILQNFALQHTLRKMGHEVLTISRYSDPMPLKMKILSLGKRIVKRISGKNVIIRTWPTQEELQIIWQNTNRFIKENIKVTHTLKSESEFKNLNQYGFEAFVVGSDQVWRPKYSPDIENHFLGFTAERSNIKRVAYAASFGVDNWEYSAALTKSCGRLAKKFDAVSVREFSGVNLCKNHLGVDAIQVIDPTLLLTANEYKQLVEKNETPVFSGKLVSYVLDKSPELKELVKKAAEILSLEMVSVMPSHFFREVGKNRVNDCIVPPVTHWIKGFMDASFVITDSFHGTVFAIIFNKPFIAVGNIKRGMARFHALLETFGLEERLITDDKTDLTELLNKPIDFKRANKVLAEKRREALAFLSNALGNNEQKVK